ncbi:MAG: stimulus-sensing domain-containing protein [Alphaproteobacteria bacterium]
MPARTEPLSPDDRASGDDDRPSSGRPARGRHTAARRRSSFGRFASRSLTRRILAINLIVLAVPVGGFFFLDEYQESLVAAELDTLRVQGEAFAGALGAGAVANVPGTGQVIEPVEAGQMLRRLVQPTNSRARLFSVSGELLADTRYLEAPRGVVRIEELPPPDEAMSLTGWLGQHVDAVLNWLPAGGDLPVYREQVLQSAGAYEEVSAALDADTASAVRRHPSGGLVMSVAVPVQRYKQVVGALMLSTGSAGIENAMRAVRIDILKVSGFALGVTILLSIYLAGTIARPLRRLAAAAERVRRGRGREVEIPEFAGRRDEIGELSRDLRDMTGALWDRMDAIERFAADVSHEIKNPLTSLRSAVETVARVSDPEQQRRLMGIILDDVQRLDRLISDISDASRVDAELSREASASVDVTHVLQSLVDLLDATAGEDAPRLVLDIDDGRPLVVQAFESRLGQVFRNIIANAISFSPRGGRVTVTARRRARDRSHDVVVTVDDEGPGIPEENLESIFRRFYSDRPHDAGCDAGSGAAPAGHSGLGLSISRQIVEATGGSIRAENRYDSAGEVLGARFIVILPAGGKA